MRGPCVGVSRYNGCNGWNFNEGTGVFSKVPVQATAPLLISVGIIIFGNIRKIDMTNWTQSFPAYMTFFLIPFTYNISKSFVYIYYIIIQAINFFITAGAEEEDEEDEAEDAEEGDDADADATIRLISSSLVVLMIVLIKTSSSSHLVWNA
jgi:xanthine/uracil/vitamin C permease (AzgA family)